MNFARLFTVSMMGFSLCMSSFSLWALNSQKETEKNPEIVTIKKEPKSIIEWIKKQIKKNDVKAERLVKFLSIKDQVSDLLHSDICGVDERNKLRDLVLGFGLKEASHSLRNIGRKNLAILDRHILRCLAEYKVIEEVKNLNDKVYFDIEKKFIKFADDNKVTIDELDLFFWWKATGFIYK